VSPPTPFNADGTMMRVPKEKTTMFDITKIEEEARKEVAEEQAKAAKTKIKAHLGKIAAAKAVLANLEREYEVILREVGSE
jgi:predicted GTPase